VGTSSVFDLTDEIPSKNVFLDAFWMDKTEITNSMYALCVEAGVCDKPTHEEYFDNSDFTNFPVINVSWYDAKTYCEWVKRRLPTEAEWEKTARSADGRLFPWGNNQKNCSTYDGDVLSCPELSSPYGVLNMMNFAREWTADWYMKNYYAQTISINPSGPETGELKVIRGNYHWRGYVANREKYIPSYSDEYTGFRCARDANP
jgi:iron(II)-dependent oxidoreductase